MAVRREPVHGRTRAKRDALERIAGFFDGVLLRAPQILLRLVQDLDEQLILRVEVPVEAALSHADPGDDLRHRRRVEPVLREEPRRHAHQLPAAVASSRRQPPGLLVARHRLGRYGWLDLAVKEGARSDQSSPARNGPFTTDPYRSPPWRRTW